MKEHQGKETAKGDARDDADPEDDAVVDGDAQTHVGQDLVRGCVGAGDKWLET